MKRTAYAGIALAALVAAGMFLGCSAYEPYEYRNEREMIQGPGLLSGEDGVFTVYGRKDGEQPRNAEAAPAGGEDDEKKDEAER